MVDWSKKHICRVASEDFSTDKAPDPIEMRRRIEPWLSAVFQSEHLGLLVGSGLPIGLANLAKTTPVGMKRIDFESYYKEKIVAASDTSAVATGRGAANFEDDLRVIIDLLRGLEIQGVRRAKRLQKEVDRILSTFFRIVLTSERELAEGIEAKKPEALRAFQYLKAFLLSFASRAASRERLNLFTTNYDRFLEFGSDDVGILLIDRFRGQIAPLFRASKLELDYHYNPPGIRGEPRYIEGVVRLYKLHGSVDWRFKGGRIVRSLLPFGAKEGHSELPSRPSEQLVIYPNSAKDVETAFYPYAEMFRDFSVATCRPNTVLVTYGYGFGDSHINRVIEDMLTIPSTHVVVVSFDLASDRIRRFCEHKNPSQFSLLIGEHYGSLDSLVDNYLPKSAIDRITIKMHELKERRGSEEAVQQPYSSEGEGS